MAEFGHHPIAGTEFHVDAWGAGPFIIHVDGKAHRFEDSERFGPVKLRADGQPSHQQWPERRRFWVAFYAWRNAGRRLESDGTTCIWDEPKPTVARVVRRQIMILAPGDEELAGIVDEAGRFLGRPDVGPNRAEFQRKKDTAPPIAVVRKGSGARHG